MARLWNRNSAGKAVFLAGASLAACIAAASPAYAQDEAEQARPAAEAADEAGDEIIVTATKRETTLQDVPFSINAQTEEDIQRSGAATIEDLSRNVAGLTVQNLGPGQSQVSIRGVSAGQIVRDQPGVKEQVGVYLDESVISLSLFTPDLDLFDLNRVETLRGPQGTLFGSGSVGGTIRYITNQPELGRVRRRWSKATSTSSTATTRRPPQGRGQRAARRQGGGPRGRLLHRLRRLHRRPARRRRRRRGRQRRQPLRRPPRAAVPADRRTSRSRRASSTRRSSADGFNRQEVYNLFANPFTTTRPAVTFGEREQYPAARRGVRGRDLARRPDRQRRLRRRRAHLGHQLHRPRHPGQPRRQRADRQRLGRPRLPDRRRCCCRRTCATPPTSSSSRRKCAWPRPATGPFQWVVGGFYADVDRIYAPAPADPGLRRLHRRDARRRHLGGGAPTASRPNSPYNADLPYDIKQMALFGEASYDFGRR